MRITINIASGSVIYIGCTPQEKIEMTESIEVTETPDEEQEQEELKEAPKEPSKPYAVGSPEALAAIERVKSRTTKYEPAPKRRGRKKKEEE